MPTQPTESQTKKTNHAKAPLSAAFVEAMRDAFGAEQISIVYLREGGLKIGREKK